MTTRTSVPPRRAKRTDLLVAECLALETLRAFGQSSTNARLIDGRERVFLEVDRFDRTERGRRGVLSLEALDAEFVGMVAAGMWSASVDALAGVGVVSPQDATRVRWLSSFGSLIGNTDMHLGNLSFFARGARVVGLAPAYDMLPMLYAPHQGHLPARSLTLAPPTTLDARISGETCVAADCAGLDPCIQLASPGDVVIVEIMVDPVSVADSAGEWLELHNTTSEDIDIAGWVLHDIDANAPQWHVIGGQGPVVIAAGGTLVLGALADPVGNGGVSIDYQWANIDLANDADEIVLEVKGERIDVVTYAVPAWPVIGGHSLSLDPASQTASANDDPSAWCLGVSVYNAMDHGTPGTTNPLCP
jgi:hypothetical protein